jgi:HD-GYP domain-containing protein (c-di-GMP phosphodiesterase class II)
MDPLDNEQNLIKIKITHLIKFAASFSGVEIYIFAAGKYIRMNYAHEHFLDILRRLQQKDLEEVHINQEDCKRVLDEIQNSISSKSFYDPKTTDDERMEKTEISVEVIKSMIVQMGVDKQTLEILKEVNKKTIGMLNESPTIFAFIERFRKSCNEEYLKAILTSYLASMVIEQFPWKSTSVKEKASIAAMLCDITLEKKDFENLRAYQKNGGELSEKIRNHPREVSIILSYKKDVIPSEVITIIEQHHELPNGSGFPNKIEAHRFNQLSSIFIVSQRFTDRLFEEKFDFSQRHEIAIDMQKTFHGRSFDKAMDALLKVVG